MFAIDAYRPDQWHDFFVMVGGSTAALTGLEMVRQSRLSVSPVRDAEWDAILQLAGE